MNEIIKQWNEKYITGIKMSNDTKLNTILFADDQVVIANSDDNLQRGLHALHQTVQAFGMKISHQKTKIMAFKGTEPIRSKIVIDNMILEEVNTFTYLGCNISYQEDKDIHSKIAKFLQILGLLNNTLKPNLGKEAQD
jgi:hypothetical protein